MQINVPLSHLKLSKHNVRQTYDPAAVMQMWAAIKARGIMQSVGVLPTRKKGHYEVHYGGLRLAPLHHGLNLEEITADTEVPCIVRDKANAREENRDEDELSNEERAELESVQQEIDTLDEKGWGYPDDVVARAVAILVVDPEGQVAPYPELYIPKATPAAPARNSGSSDTGSLDEAGEPTQGPPARKPFAEAAKLADELADQRKQIIAAGLAQAPDLAYDVAVFALAFQTLSKGSGHTHDLALQLSASCAPRLVFAARFDDSIANRTLVELRDQLDLDWLQQPDAKGDEEGCGEACRKAAPPQPYRRSSMHTSPSTATWPSFDLSSLYPSPLADEAVYQRISTPSA